MIILIFNHFGICNVHFERNLKENAPLSCAVFCARFYVIYESFPRVKDIAEFTLHRNRMFENSLVNFNRVNLLS